ncbi:MAG: putative inorganic polyphosphate/ATP-NAD kinase [Syntrophaceae bacterium PtaB.Bin095]|nr:MAG: putative inorganic polyphosphate/ATP-NAD kinase [Syntrophaceae bacterium PtaB.Bin095]
MRIGKIGIVANVAKEKSSEYALRLKKWLLDRGVQVFLDEAVAYRIGESEGMERGKLAAASDLIVVFGGDGTMLRAARAVCGHDIPILGINIGGLGYLTEVNLNEMTDAMERILKSDFRTEQRMMLDIAITRRGDQAGEGTVLNEVVINRDNLSRIVELETAVNGRHLATFKADGLIIATPTGSTAYSLSAGGPIIFPEQNAMILNPICAHTLTNRPVVLPEDVTVQVVLWTKEQGATLTLDGQVSYTLASGDTISVRKSSYVTTLVASPHRDYLEILRTKLGWGGLPAGHHRDAD